MVRVEINELEKLKNTLEDTYQGKYKEGIRELLTIIKEIKNKLPNTNT